MNASRLIKNATLPLAVIVLSGCPEQTQQPAPPTARVPVVEQALHQDSIVDVTGEGTYKLPKQCVRILSAGKFPVVANGYSDIHIQATCVLPDSNSSIFDLNPGDRNPVWKETQLLYNRK